MSLTPVEQADRSSRNRAWVMAIGAAVLFVLAAFNAGGVAPGPADTSRGLAWVLLVVLWLAVLATGGGLFQRRQLRSLMNDEVSLANRHRAIETGFWAAMAAAIALYFLDLAWPIPLRAALGMLSEVAIGAALACYAWLELR